jgi:hypothetical protein
LEFIWNLVVGIWDLFSEIARDFLKQCPRLAQVFFGREHVAEANSHHCSAAQFGLCEVSAAGSIDLLHEFAVQIVDA